MPPFCDKHQAFHIRYRIEGSSQHMYACRQCLAASPTGAVLLPEVVPVPPHAAGEASHSRLTCGSPLNCRECAESVATKFAPAASQPAGEEDDILPSEDLRTASAIIVNQAESWPPGLPKRLDELADYLDKHSRVSPSPAASQAAPDHSGDVNNMIAPAMPDIIMDRIAICRDMLSRDPEDLSDAELDVLWLADRVVELKNDLWCARHALGIAVEERNQLQASTAQETKRARALDTWRETVDGLLGHAAWCAVGNGPDRECDCVRAGLLSELYDHAR